MLLCGLKKVNLVGFNLLGALSSDLTFCDLFLLAWMMHGWKWSKKFQEKDYIHLYIMNVKLYVLVLES